MQKSSLLHLAAGLVLTLLISIFSVQSVNAFCTDAVPSKYQEAAQAMFTAGVLKGNANGTCTLNENINRVEFAVMAMRATVGDEDAKSGKVVAGLFNDYRTDSWWAPYVARAKELGILKGSNGNVEPTKNVNAAEAAVISARAHGYGFGGQEGKTWYSPTFDAFRANQVSVYDPAYRMTRGDVVLMLYQVMQKDQQLADYEVGSDDLISAAPNSTLRDFVEQIEELEPSDGAAMYRQFTSDEQAALEVLSPTFAVLAHIGACEADNSLTVSTEIGLLNCQQSMQLLNLLTSSEGFTEQALVETLQQELSLLLIREACLQKDYIGEINADNCKNYLSQLNPIVEKYKNNRSTTAFSDADSNSFDQGVMPEPVAAAEPIDPSVYQMMSNMSSSMHNSMMGVINSGIGGGTNCTLGTAGCSPF